GDVALGGSGDISSTLVSNISVANSGGTSGTLYFSGGSAVNNLSIAVGAGNQVQIGGSLNIKGGLQLTSGILNFSNGSLTLSGGISGTGMLSANTAADLAVNT